MKEHDEIDEIFRATFQDFKPDASHISDAGISSFIKSQGVAKTGFFAKLGVGTYATVGTIVVVASIVAVQVFAPDPEPHTHASRAQKVTAGPSHNTSSAAENEYNTSAQTNPSHLPADRAEEVTDQTPSVATTDGASSTLNRITEARVVQTSNTTTNGFAKISSNQRTLKKKAEASDKKEVSSAQSVRAIEDYLAEKYPVPLYFNADGDSPHKNIFSPSAEDTLTQDSETHHTSAESAVLYTEVQIPLAAETGEIPSVTEAPSAVAQTTETVLPQDSSNRIAANPDLNSKIDPTKRYVWPVHSLSVTGGPGFAALNKTGSDYIASPFYYAYNSLISGSTEVEKMFALRYDYRLPGNIAFQAGLNYHTLGWDYMRSVVYAELMGSPDSSYYQLDTADAYRQRVSMSAVGVSLATGYDILLSDKWMLGLRFGLSGNQYRARFTETDLWNGTGDLNSERNVFVMGAFGRFNAVYRFGKFGIGAGVSVNGRAALTRALEYGEIYQNVSYGIDLGIHYYPGK